MLFCFWFLLGGVEVMLTPSGFGRFVRIFVFCYAVGKSSPEFVPLFFFWGVSPLFSTNQAKPFCFCWGPNSSQEMTSDSSPFRTKGL